jgi:cell cycle sensor histidine kinase DivJ
MDKRKGDFELTQENLDKALALLDELKGDKVAEIRQALQEAKRTGEGQDADALRQRLDDMVTENSEFISFMVHEIRKPMTSIRGYSDMLVKKVMGELNDMQDQFVNTIRNNVISMEGLVTDISDLSKMRSGRIQPNAKMDMFKNINMAVEKEVKDRAEARGVTLNFEIPQGLPLLNLDSTRVEQAMVKLLDNAIKYTQEGDGQVTVRAEGDGSTLRIIISDNGVGISEQDQARLGELFFRGDNELVTATKGYGMGIPIALECMKMVGGTLEWESTSGEGTTFTITLPAMS